MSLSALTACMYVAGNHTSAIAPKMKSFFERREIQKVSTIHHCMKVDDNDTAEEINPGSHWRYLRRKRKAFQIG